MGDIIGLDIGTSSIKGIRISQDGKRKVVGKEEFVYRVGPKGQVEIDAEAYLAACCRLLRRLCSAGEEKILAVCAASASGNLLLLDQQGAPCTPILNWQDARVEEEARRILSGFDPQKLYEAIGWPFDWKTFPLAQLCYLKCHRPELVEQSSMICMSTEYLYWRLCGKWGISPSAGGPFYLLDQRSGQYYPALLAQLGIGEEKLPPVQKAGGCVGCVTQQGAALSGLKPGTPLILGTFDHPSAARGAGVFEQGQMLLSCGTSWVAFYPVENREKAIHCGMLVDPFRQPEGCWGAMASVPSISPRIEMYIHRYVSKGEDKFQRLARLAGESVPGAGGLELDLLLDPQDEMVQGYSKEHIARAIMEGAVGLVAEKIHALKKEGICAREAVMVGGPSECPLWLEIIAQMTGLSVQAAQGAYTGALGAAVTAAVALGLYESEREAFEGLRER